MHTGWETRTRRFSTAAAGAEEQRGRSAAGPGEGRVPRTAVRLDDMPAEHPPANSKGETQKFPAKAELTSKDATEGTTEGPSGRRTLIPGREPGGAGGKCKQISPVSTKWRIQRIKKAKPGHGRGGVCGGGGGTRSAEGRATARPGGWGCSPRPPSRTHAAGPSQARLSAVRLQHRPLGSSALTSRQWKWGSPVPHTLSCPRGSPPGRLGLQEPLPLALAPLTPSPTATASLQVLARSKAAPAPCPSTPPRLTPTWP